jgi:membrane-bound lytic murein transglycosylase F
MSRLMSLAVAALISAVTAGAADLPDFKKTGELRVLVVDGSPVFVSLSPSAPPGLEREILDGFAQLHGLKVRLVEIDTWANLVPALVRGRGDLAAGGVTDTPARRAHIDFTSEVFPTRDLVVSRPPAPEITSLEQLRGVRVGTIKGTSLADRVAEAQVPRENMDDVPATGYAEALKSGRVQVVVDGIEDALLLKRADPTLQLGMFLGPPQSLAFGVRKDAPLLRQALSEYLGNFRRTPTWNRLVVKYFGDSAMEVLRRARSQAP